MAPSTARSASRLCGGIRDGNSMELIDASHRTCSACAPMVRVRLRSGQEKSVENVTKREEPVDSWWITSEDDVTETRARAHHPSREGAATRPRCRAGGGLFADGGDFELRHDVVVEP